MTTPVIGASGSRQIFVANEHVFRINSSLNSNEGANSVLTNTSYSNVLQITNEGLVVTGDLIANNIYGSNINLGSNTNVGNGVPISTCNITSDPLDIYVQSDVVSDEIEKISLGNYMAIRAIDTNSDGSVLLAFSSESSYDDKFWVLRKNAFYSWSSNLITISPKTLLVTESTALNKRGVRGCISNDGNRIAVTMGIGGLNSGISEVYDYVNQTWTLRARFEELKSYGWGIAMNKLGTRYAITAPNNDNSGTNFQGKLYVYEYVSSSNLWTLSFSRTYDNWPDQVTFSDDGNTLALSCTNIPPERYEEFDLLATAVSVRILQYSNGAWNLQANDIVVPAPFNVHYWHYWGKTLKLSGNGNKLAVGAPGFFENWAPKSGNYSNAVYIYEKTNNVWGSNSILVQPASYSNLTSASNTYNQYGAAISINFDGTKMLVGAPNTEYNGSSDEGRVHVHSISSLGNWTENGSFKGSNVGQYGISLAMTNDTKTYVVAGNFYVVTPWSIFAYDTLYTLKIARAKELQVQGDANIIGDTTTNRLISNTVESSYINYTSGLYNNGQLMNIYSGSDSSIYVSSALGIGTTSASTYLLNVQGSINANGANGNQLTVNTSTPILTIQSGANLLSTIPNNPHIVAVARSLYSTTSYTVTSWSSGGDRVLTAYETNKPTYVPSGGFKNFAYVSFDRSLNNHIKTVFQYNSFFMTDFTIVILVRFIGTTISRETVFDYGDENRCELTIYRNENTNSFNLFYNGNYNNRIFANIYTNVPQDTWMLWTIRGTNVGGNLTVQSYLNGVLQNSSTQASPSMVGFYLSVLGGRRRTGTALGGKNDFTGHIGGIHFYRYSLQDSQLSALHRYYLSGEALGIVNSICSLQDNANTSTFLYLQSSSNLPMSILYNSSGFNYASTGFSDTLGYYIQMNGGNSMNVSSGGSVGIGTTNPQALLQIRRDTASRTHAVVENISTAAGAWAEVSARTGTDNFGIRIGALSSGWVNDGGYVASGGFLDVDAISGGLSIISRNASTGIIRFYTGGHLTERMRLDVSGNLGISTNNPQAVIHARRDQTSRTSAYVENYSTGVGAYAEVAARNGSSSTTGTRLGVLGTGWNNDGGYLANGGFLDTEASLAGGLSILSRHSTGGIIRFYTGGGATGNERMRIDIGGNVGIGTTTPLSKLHISNGSLYIQNNQFTGTTAFHGGVIGTDAAFPAVWLLGSVIGNDGSIRIHGTINGSRRQDGRMSVDITFMSRDSYDIYGSVSGLVNGNQGLMIYRDTTNGTMYGYVYGGNFMSFNVITQGNYSATVLPNPQAIVNGTSAFTPPANTTLVFNTASVPLGVPTNYVFHNANGTTRYTLNTNGNTGMGTTIPNARLDVAGNLYVNGYNSGAGSPLMRVSPNVSGNESSIGFYQNVGNGASGGMVWVVGHNTSSVGSGNFGIYSSTTNANAISILGGNGFVGIGTNNPASRLQLDADGDNLTLSTTSSGYNSTYPSTTIAFRLRSPSNYVMGRISLQDQSIGSSFMSDMIFIVIGQTGSSSLSECMRIKGQTGHVGIGITNPVSRLHVNGTASIAGNIVATGSITQFGTISDERFKVDITPITSASEKIKLLQPVEYVWGEKIASINSEKVGKPDCGFIAQHVEPLFPLVTEEVSFMNGEPIKGIKYDRLIPYMVKAMQEYQQRIDALESKVQVLEQELLQRK